MKKIIYLLIITLSSTLAYAQTHIAGTWTGAIDIHGNALHFVFHFNETGNGQFSGTMDSPDQGVFGIPIDEVNFVGTSLKIEIKKIKCAYVGSLQTDSTIIGNWEQGSRQIPLSLTKGGGVPKLNRPQTPVPPFKYNTEDIEYDNTDKTVHFGATFTYPKGDGPFPTAILISGSGQQDRDETILGHKPFAVIADYLSNRGIAVLRIDDRSIGKSTGDVYNATSADFANDVEAGISYLKNRKEVDQKKIGLIGHSEGGLIASIVASRNPDIDFVIMLAGPCVKGSDILIQQNEDVLKTAGMPADALSEYKGLYKKIVEDVQTENGTARLSAKLLTDFREWRARQTTDVLNTLKISADTSSDQKIVNVYVHAFASPWMRYFLETDPAPVMEKFKCKVLALAGSKDLEVSPKINLQAIHAALQKSKSPAFETKEISGLNHLFQQCKKCTIAEYSEIEETFAPEALEIMHKWLKKNVM